MYSASERIVNILSDNSSKSTGSILLTGPWGSGKTYLWENEILPTLRNKRINPIYISLFGAHSLDDIKVQLLSSWVKASTSGLMHKSIDISGKAKAFLGPIAKIVTGTFGVDVQGVRIDWFQFIPENLIICIDDLERSSLDQDLLLGFINQLVEHKKAKVLLIANEEKIRNSKDNKISIYDSYKEKVVWTTIHFNPDLAKLFDLFIAESGNVDLFTERKESILSIFSNCKSKNGRTLQRVLRFTKEVLDAPSITLEESKLKFLVAVIIEDATNGLLDKEIYDVRQYLLVDLMKEAESEAEGNEGTRRSLNFFKQYVGKEDFPDFSSSLFNFVKYGLLDIEELRRELSSAEDTSTEDQALLAEARNGEWLFKEDEQISEFINRVTVFLFSDKPATAYRTLYLYYEVLKLSEQIKIPLASNLKGKTRDRILALADTEDVTIHEPYFEYRSSKEMLELEGFVKEYKEAKNESVKRKISKEVSAVIQSRKQFNLGRELIIKEFYLQICLQDGVLLTINTYARSKPEMFYSFYRSLIEALSSDGSHLNGIKRDESYKVIKVHLERILNENHRDLTTQKRIGILLDLIPSKI